MPVRYVAYLHLSRTATYYAARRTKVPKYLIVGGSGGKKKKKRRKKLNEKEYRDERWDEGWSPGHVTGRRGAKRRTRRRPPPGASPAAPCLSLPVSIFFLLVFSYSYSASTTLVFSGLRSFPRLRRLRSTLRCVKLFANHSPSSPPWIASK